MSFDRWLLFLGLESALSLSPGPAVLYVVSQGTRSVPRAFAATLGILSANAIYFALSATSLGAVVAASGRFFNAVRWVGAAYLVFLGLKALRAAALHARDAATACPDHAVSSVETEAALPGRQHVYRGALALQLSNPKALLSFLALLPQFIDSHRPIVPQMMVLAATSMLPEFCILSGYGWLAHRAAGASKRFGFAQGFTRWLDWIEGFGLLGCAELVFRISRPR